MIVKAIYRKCDNAKGIVIFIHGIVESPAPFAEQMDIAYNSGMSVASMILPGHGGTTIDFARPSVRYFEKHANPNYLQLTHGGRCAALRNVFVCPTNI